MIATRRILLSFLAVILLSCSGPASTQDEEQLAKLKQRFGDRFAFEFDQGIYLYARRHAPGTPSRSEAEEIYRLFWFDSRNQSRTSTRFAYLNIYDQSGRFQFQLFWDSGRGRLTYSDAEHY